ncbi:MULTISPECIES: YqaA family protein [unclassified Bartonella]|uniref:YqaA family protein n=1 Tax=unclassified Bartonella TaxID=2645622 RepID=UPI0021C8FB93|nr:MULTISPECIES: YqaA family protein [unclassified Bartonella]UXN03253.1 DedA family protein [Bartonella sp. HY406]UXN06208.1 DedA family protein [Bartonella sp. HY761]
MLKRLTAWTISLAGRKSAQYWLAFVAFIESSVFLIPADVLFVPMAMVKPKNAYRYALIATLFSVLGGVAGWLLGHYAYEAVAKPVLEFYGKLEAFEALRGSSSVDFILFLLVTSGLSHLPPIKVVTILSGAAGINIWLFIISAILARGARFYLLAWVLRKYGPSILDFVVKRLTLVVAVICVIVIIGFTAYKLLH